MGVDTRRAIAACAVSLVLGLAVGLVVSPPNAARAQQPTAEPPQYRTWIGRAVSEYEAGRWAEARANFRRAHAAFPNARTLRGIGMTSFELGEYVEALRHLTAALTESQRPLTPEQRREVTDLVERARTYTGRYRVRIEPTGTRAAITVDGAAVALDAEGALVLDIGRRELAVRAEGYEAVTRSLQVRGGEDESVVIALRATSATSAATTSSALASTSGGARTTPTIDSPGTTDQSPETLPEPGGGDGVVVAPARGRRRTTGETDRGGGSAVASIVSFGAAGALLAGSAASLVWFLDRADAADSCGSGPEGPCVNGSTIEGERDLALGSTIALGAAAVGAAVVGIVLLPSGDGDGGRAPRGPRRASLSCLPTTAGVVCSGAF